MDSVSVADPKVLFLMFLATVIGSGGSWLAQQAWKLYANRNEQKEKAEKTITDHLNALIARLDLEKKESDEIIRVLTARVMRCDVNTTALRLHVRYLERVLSDNKLAFVAYVDPPAPEPVPLGVEHVATVRP